jgi:hypothetical protein
LYAVFLNKENLYCDGNDIACVNLVHVYSFIKELDGKGKLSPADKLQIKEQNVKKC